MNLNKITKLETNPIFNNLPLLLPQVSCLNQRDDFSYLNLFHLCNLQKFYLRLLPRFDFLLHYCPPPHVDYKDYSVDYQISFLHYYQI
ncbi:unnamed protein product [Meloidogyne enterolobii]|uniref:Uncharacterized protein n=1 Tax=Meloidogyne enterolobii TaxID=390850 RepID=A0ACB0ZZU6_MELEN